MRPLAPAAVEPRAMNRQVVPSMLLSVFIVCFFAVVLRPVEPSGGRAAVEPPLPAESWESPPPVAQTEPKTEPESEPEPKSEPVPVEPALEPATPPELVAKAAAAPEPKPKPDPTPEPIAADPSPPSPIETAARVAPKVAEPSPPPRMEDRAEIRIASTPAPRRVPHPLPPPPEPPPAAEAPAPRPSKAKEVELVSIPRVESESTVIGEGETLEDVALRVYGSRAAAATLRDANRGLVGRLRPGALLWTPPR